jgi:hypothetical protein
MKSVYKAVTHPTGSHLVSCLDCDEASDATHKVWSLKGSRVSMRGFHTAITVDLSGVRYCRREGI